MEKLTDREVDIMMAIWNSNNEAVPTGEILSHTNRSQRNSLQTLQVILRRLCEKQAIVCEKGKRTNLYRALITEQDYLKFAVTNFTAYHFHGSSKKMLLFVLKEMKINKKEIDEILRKISECELQPN